MLSSHRIDSVSSLIQPSYISCKFTLSFNASVNISYRCILIALSTHSIKQSFQHTLIPFPPTLSINPLTFLSTLLDNPPTHLSFRPPCQPTPTHLVQVYALREVDRLEVQKIAGRIVPALATTTSMVAGLVTLELVKIAVEKVRQRRIQRQLMKMKQKTSSKNQQNLSPQKSKTGSKNGSKTGQQNVNKMDDNDVSTVLVEAEESRRSRLLQTFRNSFVNLARPLLAFAQPVEAESFDVQGERFNLWTSLHTPENAYTLTVGRLETYLQDRFQVQLQSVSIGDMLLYADFLPDAEETINLSLPMLVRRVERAAAEAEALDAQEGE